MKMVYVLAGAVVVAGGFAIFGGAKNTLPTAETAQASPAGPGQAATDETDPAGSPNDETASGDDIVEGTVLEKLDVPSYTYLRIGAAGSDGQWVAVSTTPVEVGKSVRVRGETVMTNFQSPTLKRTFESIRFGVIDTGGGGDKALPAGHPNTGAGSATAAGSDVKVGKVAKAEGANGRRIAEIYAQKKQLAGKPVKVRGVVVKVTSGVMGKNFAHIHDGSGQASSKDDDITLTTSSDVQLGQTILVEGTLTLDKDLGAGYRYDAILEDAKLVNP